MTVQYGFLLASGVCNSETQQQGWSSNEIVLAGSVAVLQKLQRMQHMRHMQQFQHMHMQQFQQQQQQQQQQSAARACTWLHISCLCKAQTSWPSAFEQQAAEQQARQLYSATHDIVLLPCPVLLPLS